MAPATPPPWASCVLAAFAIASTSSFVTSTCITSSSATELLHPALQRLLVRPPPLELATVPDPVPGDVVEVHLAHELGAEALPYELLVGLPAARLARASLIGPIR